MIQSNKLRTEQPQLPTQLASRFLAYKPKVVFLPAAGLNSVTNGIRGSFANDAKVQSGAFEFPGANGYIDFGSSALVTQNAHTLLMVYQADSFPSTYPVLTRYLTSGTPQCVFITNSDASYSDLHAGEAFVNGGRVSLSGSGPLLGTRRNVVITRSGTTLGHSFFVNGAQLTTQTSAQSASVSSNNIIGQSGTGSLANDFDGRIWLFALFDSVLPRGVATALSANPWQMFAPQRRIFVPVSAVPGALLGGATVTDLTSSSFRPRVNILSLPT